MPERRWAPLLLLCLAALFVGCRRPAAAPQAAVLHDLNSEVALADREAPATFVLFGTPDAEAFVERGLVRGDGAEPSAWARREVRLVLRWPRVEAREAVLDVEPCPGLDRQALEVLLNEAPVGRFELTSRTAVRVPLPPEHQVKGENLLRLVFSRSTPPGQGRRLSAVVRSLAVGAQGDGFLAALTREGGPHPFETTRAADGPRLALVSGTALRYALRPPQGGSELRFTPVAAGAGQARLRVTLETEGGEPRELWARRLDGTEAGEIVVPLEAPAGSSLRLGFEVAGAPGAAVALGSPRIFGRGPERPVLRTPLSEAEDHKADALRSRLGRPNVLFVIFDAGGARHFGCYGSSRPTTPEIDRIAAEGITFERAYTPAVFTLSAMASVWTSLYPDEHHRNVPYDAPLPAGPLTLAELLSARGILTAGFVANGVAGPAFGLDRGFGEFHEVFREHGHGADAFAAVLPGWIRSHVDQRFFAYLHFREPHFPYDPPAPFTTRFGPDGPLPRGVRAQQAWVDGINAGKIHLSPAEADHLGRLYDGNLAFADQELGRLRRTLEAAGLWERTVVILAADHGEGLLEHDFVGHNKQLYEESVHVPLILRLPAGAGPAGLRVRELVDLLDLAPTIADLFALKGQGGSAQAFSGRSLLAVAAGAPGVAAVFSRTASGEKPSYAVRDGRFAFIRNMRYGSEELFDMQADAQESHNLRSARPVEAAYYRQLLFRWLIGLKRGPADEGGAKAQLTPEQRENLRALGYVQ